MYLIKGWVNEDDFVPRFSNYDAEEKYVMLLLPLEPALF